MGDNELEFICWMELYKDKKWKVYDWNRNEKNILNRKEFFKKYNLDINNIDVTALYIFDSEKLVMVDIGYNTYLISIIN